MSSPILTVKDLKTYFYSKRGIVKAADNVSFDILKGEITGMVGESGCGKSVTCLSILRLIREPPGKIVSGTVMFDGRDVLSLNNRQMRKVRGNEISMIFQEPMTSLNPVLTIGRQIEETVMLHEKCTRKDALEKTIEFMKLVGIPYPEKRIKEYPHQFSGGMRQRAMIAMALVSTPSLLIADEPTTALDVTVQAQILDLIKDLRSRLGMAILIITHDLGVVAEIADKVLVMYAGRIVEESDAKSIFIKPGHPYTQALLASMPGIDTTVKRLHFIKGSVPDPLCYPEGCRFHPRCEFKREICTRSEPPLMEQKTGHKVRCWIGTAAFLAGA